VGDRLEEVRRDEAEDFKATLFSEADFTHTNAAGAKLTPSASSKG
jgi:hypothetical protein